MPKYTARFHENGICIDVQEGSSTGILFEYGRDHFRHCLRSTPNGWIFAFCEEECEFNKVHKIECILFEDGKLWRRDATK